jgi:hypothetical protein
MRMTVVNVRIVRMSMAQLLVPVNVDVRLFRRILG